MEPDAQGPSIDLDDTEVVAQSLRAYGSNVDGVRVPHAGQGPQPGCAPRRRVEREESQQLLAPGAARCEGAGVRVEDEEPDVWRTAFECDLDRIRHSKPFRRLGGKTQVHIAARNEHLRNRLTHAIEVSQVAGAIARACGLNLELTEAIALGHDCGHGPTGHASEEAFSPFLPGGFDHAVWGAEVTLAPLNLCVETLDGIMNHSWRRPTPGSAEGVAVAWADRIAYVCHDFDDAVRAELVGVGDLPDEVRALAGERQGDQIAAFVTSVLRCVERTGVLGMDEEHAEALDAFRRFNYDRIYLRPESRRQAEKAIVMLRALVERYADTPSLLGLELPSGSPAAVAASVEWVAGMTDRFAMTAAVELCGWDPTALPRGV